jgi:hypothetical protein
MCSRSGAGDEAGGDGIATTCNGHDKAAVTQRFRLSLVEVVTKATSEFNKGI